MPELWFTYEARRHEKPVVETVYCADKKKGFLKYVNSKRRSKENNGPIFNEDDPLGNRDVEEVKAFNAFFASIFNINERPCAVQCSELEDHDWGNRAFPLVETDIIKRQCICSMFISP